MAKRNIQLRDMIQSMLDKAGASGLTCADVEKSSGYAQNQVGHAFAVACKEGVCFKAKISHKSVRYFNNPVVAMKYQAEHAKATLTAGVHINGYIRPSWDKNTPVIVPPDVKITICPSPAVFGPAAKLRLKA